MYSQADNEFMQRALTLAARGLYTTTPNPRVGCVLVSHQSGTPTVIAEGWHEQAGSPHAEAHALQAAMAVGVDPRGATAYVTLEPCAHQGRTPPCADALIQAGVARVIAAMADPNPLVAGRGLARLRSAGIDVRCGLLAEAAHELNLGFIQRMTTGKPWVRLKVASSLDGRIALENGESQWITGQVARNDGHAWRARACAILTGSGTVRTDNPQLNVRAVATTRQPRKVVVDSQLTLNPDARIFQSGNCIIATTRPADAHPDAARLQARGVDIWQLPADAGGYVDLPTLIQRLGEAGINELHVEAGSHLNGRLLSANLVDELLLYMAPSLLGPGKPAFVLPELQSLDEVTHFKLFQVETVGQDLRIQLRRRT